MLRLVFKNTLKHPLRSLFTTGAVMLAMFLLCILRSLVTTLEAAVEQSATNRIVVQSAVSLFVSLPESYITKIEGVEGVERVTWWNWFGGKYAGEEAPLNQFGVRMGTFLEVYDEIELIDGSIEEFMSNKTSCIIGKDLAKQRGFEVGDRIPLVSELYVRRDRGAWEFDVAGIYESDTANVDNGTLFFNYEYMDEMRESGQLEPGPTGVSIFVVKVEPGYDPVVVMSDIDALYENGPQRVQATSEANFQAQFVSMVGNIPALVNAIGFAALAAVLLATLNTMLMAAREQTHDIGVLKALGFQDGSVFFLMLAQSMFVVLLGGFLGIALALLASPVVGSVLGSSFPGYHVARSTTTLAALLTVGLGVVAGFVPAMQARGMLVVDALRARF